MIDAKLGGNDPKSQLIAKVRSHLAEDFLTRASLGAMSSFCNNSKRAVTRVNGINLKNPMHRRLDELDLKFETCVLEGATAYCLEEKAKDCDAAARRYRIFAKQPLANSEDLAKKIAQIRPSSAGR